eukprot:2125634-Rhodomonas_salina.1
MSLNTSHSKPTPASERPRTHSPLAHPREKHREARVEGLQCEHTETQTRQDKGRGGMWGREPWAPSQCGP